MLKDKDMSRKIAYLSRNSVIYNINYLGNILYKKIHKYDQKDFCIKEDICVNYVFNKDIFTGEICTLSEENKLSIIEEANEILEHKISILGYKNICLDQEIKWNIDYINGYEWRDEYYKNIRKVKDLIKKDIKIPWEISRLQHLIVLIKAYSISKDRKYSEECISQIINWINSNPILYGVNWACTMEVSIRAVNMLIVTTYLNKYNIISEIDKKIIAESLYQHMLFIKRNIEYGVIRGNHYLSNFSALIILGIAFINTKEGRKNIKIAIKNIEKEINFQVNKDGTNHESSTNYHLLVTEMFLMTYIFCLKAGIELSENYKMQLKKMVYFIFNIIKPNGDIPSIGDNDSGIFIKYCSKTNRCLDLLSVYGLVFNDKLLWENSNRNEELIQLIFDKKFINEKLRGIMLSSNEMNDKEVFKYKDGGYYIFKDREVYVIFRAGNIGLKGRGGHGHCDQLSFELNILSNDIFVDLGTYTYTSDLIERNRFRSTESHNTLMINELEQDSINIYKPFDMRNESKTKVLEIISNRDNSKIIAEHYGYKNKIGAIHRRKFDYKKNEKIFKITDYIIGKENNELKWNFNLSPSYISIKHNKSSVEIEFENVVVKFCYNYNDICVSIEKAYISKVYGEKIETKKIVCKNKKKLEKYEFLIEYKIKGK